MIKLIGNCNLPLGYIWTMSIKELILLTIFFLFGLSSVAKINCDFIADTTRACAPKQISFTDLSTITSGSITYWNWDFGNGGFSNLKNPSRVYATPGVYTVTLTVSDGIDTCTITKTTYLTLFKSPVADFSTVTISKCIPVEVNFTDKSTLGDAPIKTYKWDFGDLSPPGSGKNANHKYKFPGTYSIVFTVVDTNGCASTSKPFNVPVGAPKANFTGTPRVDCLPPLKTTFNNLSTSRNPTTYLWLFGDGKTSTSKNPTNNYTKSGSFDVKLIVTDKYGCMDTSTRKKYVNIGSVSADFIIPDTLCLFGSDSLINISSGAKFFKWTFGNGGISIKRSPTVTFTKEGYTTIKLVASSDTNCVDSITKRVYVEKIISDFDIIQKDICDPNTIEFKDKSQGNISSTKFHLDMGTRLTHVYSSSKNFTYVYPKSYCATSKWKVNYTVKSSSGCEAVKTKFITIFNDQLVGKVKSTNACVPTDFTFNVLPCLRFPAVKWSWNFNTGNPADTSNLKTPKNVIRKTIGGRYLATVTVIDSNGCKYTHNIPYEVGEKQKADFRMSKDTICYGDTVQFTNLSTDVGKIDSYNWDLGDRTYSTLINPKHGYGLLGRLKIKLVVWNFTCQDTVSKYLYVSGPISSIISHPDCANPLNQTFRLGIGGSYTRFYWNFGDTTGIDSVNSLVFHKYKHYIPYKVTLKVFNDSTGCVDSSVVKLSPTLLKAHFKINNSNICKSGDAYFDATASQGRIAGRYFWDFGDGQVDSYVSKPKHRYYKSGKFKVRLIILTADSCRDTTFQNIFVSTSNLNFKINKPVICNGDSLTILNLSRPDTTINLFRWSFGNSIISTDTNLNYKFVLPIKSIDSNSLINSDSSFIKLYARNALGCLEEKILPLIVVHLRANYEITDSSLCRGDEITFIDSRLPSNISHLWIFGDGDSSNVDEPKHKFLSSGNFLTKYVVTEAPCADTMIIPISVQGIDSVGFTASLRDTNCYPATIFFDDFSKGDSITWRTWDFGDGNPSIRSPLKDSLTKTFLQPGIFNIKVVVETSNGCTDSITYKKHIEIRGPYSRFSVFPDTLCKYDPIIFVHDTSNQYTWSLTWDFADGRVDVTEKEVDTLRHRYSRVGKLLTILLFKDSAGECKKFFTKEILVEDVNANFKFNVDSFGCEPFTTKFEDKSVDGDTWRWSFGDGNNSGVQHPENTFLKVGKYPVELIYLNSKNGCKDTASREVLVLPLPDVLGSGDLEVCYGDSAQLQAEGALSYLWTPDFRLTNNKISNPKAGLNESHIYLLAGTDSNNCTNTTNVAVYVQQIPEVSMPEDKIIIIGEEFPLIPNISNGSKYRWEPPTGLSCSDCPNPVAKPLKNTTYTLFVTDSLGCFETKKSFRVEVEPKFSLDVPEVFTPNGDGINDFIFPNGWGIQNLLEFKIFNRWGELVFEATKETPGWDGYYKGKLQNMETYVYYAKAQSYADEVISKEGYFTLVR